MRLFRKDGKSFFIDSKEIERRLEACGVDPDKMILCKADDKTLLCGVGAYMLDGEDLPQDLKEEIERRTKQYFSDMLIREWIAIPQEEMCSTCVHKNDGLESDACRSCGEEMSSWARHKDGPRAIITQIPMSWDEAESAFANGERLFVELYAQEYIGEETEFVPTDAIAFMRRTLYNLGVNDGILCGFRYWRTYPTEAERMSAEWTRI